VPTSEDFLDLPAQQSAAYRRGKWNARLSDARLLVVAYLTVANFLYDPCPVLATPFGGFLGLQDADDQSVLVCLFRLTPTDVAVISVIANYLLALVEYMGTSGGQSLDGFKGLLVFSILL
jgi:hypothetical protein